MRKKLGMFTIWFMMVAMAVLNDGCSTPKYIQVPVESTRTIVQRDTVIVSDTIVITPPVVIKTVVPLFDTLKMDYDGVSAVCWNDSVKLRGTMKSQGRKTVSRWEERRSDKTDTVVITKSVPVEKEVPVPYVPRLYRWLSIWGGICFVLVLLWLFFKFKRWRK